MAAAPPACCCPNCSTAKALPTWCWKSTPAITCSAASVQACWSMALPRWCAKRAWASAWTARGKFTRASISPAMASATVLICMAWRAATRWWCMARLKLPAICTKAVKNPRAWSSTKPWTYSPTAWKPMPPTSPTARMGKTCASTATTSSVAMATTAWAAPASRPIASALTSVFTPLAGWGCSRTPSRFLPNWSTPATNAALRCAPCAHKFWAAITCRCPWPTRWKTGRMTVSGPNCPAACLLKWPPICKPVLRLRKASPRCAPLWPSRCAMAACSWRAMLRTSCRPPAHAAWTAPLRMCTTCTTPSWRTTTRAIPAAWMPIRTRPWPASGRASAFRGGWRICCTPSPTTLTTSASCSRRNSIIYSLRAMPWLRWQRTTSVCRSDWTQNGSGFLRGRIDDVVPPAGIEPAFDP